MVTGAIKRGVSVKDLAVMDLADMNAILLGKTEERESLSLEMWRNTRYLAYVHILSIPGLKPHQKPKKPEDLFWLKGDARPKVYSQSYLKKRHERILTAWDKRRMN